MEMEEEKGGGTTSSAQADTTISNVGIREAEMNTDYRMVLEVLRREGAQRNGAYQRRSRC